MPAEGQHGTHPGRRSNKNALPTHYTCHTGRPRPHLWESPEALCGLGTPRARPHGSGTPPYAAAARPCVRGKRFAR